MRRPVVVLAALGAALPWGCPKREATTPTAPSAVRVPASDGGMHHSQRLASGSWRSDGAYRACGRRTADFTVAGEARGCVVGEPAAAASRPLPAAPEVDFVPDHSAVDAAPAGCRVRHDDVSGDPGAGAARATLWGQRSLTLDAWLPPPAVDGDYFAIETSWSPDGRWLAVIHSAVGLGEGDRTVDVISVEVRAAPGCPLSNAGADSP